MPMLPKARRKRHTLGLILALAEWSPGSRCDLLNNPLQVVLEHRGRELLELTAQDFCRIVGPLEPQELLPANWTERRRKKL